MNLSTLVTISTLRADNNRGNEKSNNFLNAVQLKLGIMLRPGIRRLLTTASTPLGDGIHARQHHQQASDFLRSKKYRNPYNLLTCSSCHDPHGTSDEYTPPVAAHQLSQKLDTTGTSSTDLGTPGLCLGCHSPYFPAGADVRARMATHYSAELGVTVGGKRNLQCSDCHNPKTAKSGAGLRQGVYGDLNAVQYWSGDITSHLFKVPRKATVSGKADASISGSDLMYVPYTESCGGCHSLP